MLYLNLNFSVNEQGKLESNLCCSGSWSTDVFKNVMEAAGNNFSRLIEETAAKLPEERRYDFVMGCACALNKSLMDQVESYETVK